MTIYILGFYQAKASDSLGCITFYYSVMTSIDFIGILLLSIPEASHNIRLYYGAILTAKSTELIIGLVIRKIWKRKSGIQAIPKEIRRLMFFSGALILMGAFIRGFKAQDLSMSKDIILMIIGITILSNFSLLYLLLAAKSELEKTRLRDAAKRTRMQLELYKSKQELYKKQGKRIHDHKNQLLSISHMLEQGQGDQALAYTRKLTGHMAKELDILQTGHPIADTILNIKKQEALDKEISINFMCSSLKDISLEEEDIIILLGNLLDNAIEAASGCAETKNIQVHISLGEKQLVIKIKNTCPHALRLEDGRIATTKSDPETHEYGLETIQDIVDKQDGSFAIRQETM